MWKHLISHPPADLPDHGHFIGQNEIRAVKSLHIGDAKAFINTIDEVPPRPLSFRKNRSTDLDLNLRFSYQALDALSLVQWIRRKCLSTLCRICGRWALLPISLRIPPCYNRSEPPQDGGTYGEVWMGAYQGRQVTVEVLRMYLKLTLIKLHV